MDHCWIANENANHSNPTWAPDGKRIAFVSTRDFNEGSFEIYVIGSDGTGLRCLTNNAAIDSNPVWSPDGKWLAVAERRDGKLEIYVMDVGGANRTPVVDDTKDNFSPSWRP